MESVFGWTAVSACNRVRREDAGIDQALLPGQWTSSQFVIRSAAMIVMISALVPRVFVIVAVMIPIVVTLMVTRAGDDASR